MPVRWAGNQNQSPEGRKGKMRTEPTENQARRIARARNAERIRNGNATSPPIWAVVDDGELFIGSGDSGQTKPVATTWAAAQEIVRLAESR